MELSISYHAVASKVVLRNSLLKFEVCPSKKFLSKSYFYHGKKETILLEENELEEFDVKIMTSVIDSIINVNHYQT